jgi:hypothetical protein
MLGRTRHLRDLLSALSGPLVSPLLGAGVFFRMVWHITSTPGLVEGAAADAPLFGSSGSQRVSRFEITRSIFSSSELPIAVNSG